MNLARASSDNPFDLEPSSVDGKCLGVYLGSFDPPHRGHQWLARQLFKRAHKVLILLPRVHPHKKIQYPLNSTLDQRQAMLELAFKEEKAAGLLGLGMTREVLFIRLLLCLEEAFPGATILLGMGDETFKSLCESRLYFERLGIPWEEHHERRLASIRQNVFIFGRTNPGREALPVPRKVREISSTQVRTEILRLRDRGVSEEKWGETLDTVICRPVLDYIRENHLYASSNPS